MGVEKVTRGSRVAYEPRSYSKVSEASGNNNLRLTGKNLDSFSISYHNVDQHWGYTDNNGGYYHARDQSVFLTNFEITLPPQGC